MDKLVKVTVADSCQYKGREVGPGDEIEVSESQLPWLREEGVIAPERAKPRTKTKSTKKRAAPSGKDATEPLEDDNADPPEEAGDTPTEG